MKTCSFDEFQPEGGYTLVYGGTPQQRAAFRESLLKNCPELEQTVHPNLEPGAAGGKTMSELMVAAVRDGGVPITVSDARASMRKAANHCRTEGLLERSPADLSPLQRLQLSLAVRTLTGPKAFLLSEQTFSTAFCNGMSLSLLKGSAGPMDQVKVVRITECSAEAIRETLMKETVKPGLRMLFRAGVAHTPKLSDSAAERAHHFCEITGDGLRLTEAAEFLAALKAEA